MGRQHAGVAPLAPRTRSRSKNFGLPVVDKLFGTAYLPKGRRPAAFGVEDPVPAAGYLAHLAYPFTGAAQRPARPALLHEPFE